MDGNGQQWRWMAIEMAMSKRMAMDYDGDGLRWMATMDRNSDG